MSLVKVELLGSSPVYTRRAHARPEQAYLRPSPPWRMRGKDRARPRSSAAGTACDCDVRPWRLPAQHRAVDWDAAANHAVTAVHSPGSSPDIHEQALSGSGAEIHHVGLDAGLAARQRPTRGPGCLTAFSPFRWRRAAVDCPACPRRGEKRPRRGKNDDISSCGDLCLEGPRRTKSPNTTFAGWPACRAHLHNSPSCPVPMGAGLAAAAVRR